MTFYVSRSWSRSTVGTLLQVTFHKNPWTLRGVQDFQTCLWGKGTLPKDSDRPRKKEDSEEDSSELQIRDLFEMQGVRKYFSKHLVMQIIPPFQHP